MLEPPTNATVTLPLHHVLNHNLTGFANTQGPIGERFLENSTIYIQKCKTAPTPNLFIAAWPNKRGPFFENIRTFVSKEVPNPREFFRTFLASLHQARLVLMKEPCMSYDFQALLDVYGNWYYIDFDRCLQPTAQEELDHTLKVLKEMEKSVRKAVGSMLIN
jgi:hypothetical protein